MMTWLNGAFGVGARIFDPDLVGRMLRDVIAEPIEDFQDVARRVADLVAAPPGSPGSRAGD